MNTGYGSQMKPNMTIPEKYSGNKKGHFIASKNKSTTKNVSGPSGGVKKVLGVSFVIRWSY